MCRRSSLTLTDDVLLLFGLSPVSSSWSDPAAPFRADLASPSPSNVSRGVGGAGFNSMAYSNKKYDELSEQQLRELDVAKRIDIIVEQTNIVNDEVAAGVIVFRKSIVGSSPRVHNYFPNGFGTVWSIPYTWVQS